MLTPRHCWPCLALALGCSQPPPTSSGPKGKTVLVAPGAGQPNVLVFHRTQGFRHESIPAGLSALAELAQQGGFGLTATEDDQQFTSQSLQAYDAVIFLSTTGDVLTTGQQASFEGFIAAGNGYVGIHAAADCEYDWPFYGNLVGAYFGGHSLVVPATLNVEPVTHPAVTGLTAPWQWTDEWYGFKTNPRPQVTVLMTVDETSYDPGQGMMGADHPVAWYHAFQGGRAFYTALGHTSESFSDPQFRAHLLGGIRWAAGLAP